MSTQNQNLDWLERMLKDTQLRVRTGNQRMIVTRYDDEGYFDKLSSLDRDAVINPVLMDDSEFETITCIVANIKVVNESTAQGGKYLSIAVQAADGTNDVFNVGYYLAPDAKWEPVVGGYMRVPIIKVNKGDVVLQPTNYDENGLPQNMNILEYLRPSTQAAPRGVVGRIIATDLAAVLVAAKANITVAKAAAPAA